MNCRKCRDRLERYLDSELAAKERAELERHLESCADCRQQLEELKALSTVLQARPGNEPPPEFLAGFNDRFWQEVKRRRRMGSVVPERRYLSLVWTRIAATAAAALLLIVVGLVGYRSWHTFFDHPVELSREALASQAAPELGKATEAAPSKTVARGAAQAEDVEAEKQPESEPATAGELARPVNPPVPVQPAQANARVPSPGLEMKAASGTGKGMSAQKLEIQQASPPVVSGSGPGYSAGAKKGGLKLAEDKGTAKSEQAPRPEVGGVGARVADTTIYSEERLTVKPVLVSIPEAGDAERTKYPNTELPVWVVIEKDGSVSRAESRSTTANSGLENVALRLARQARFTPGKLSGSTVRASKTIMVKINSLKHRDD